MDADWRTKGIFKSQKVFRCSGNGPEQEGQAWETEQGLQPAVIHGQGVELNKLSTRSVRAQSSEDG